MGAPFSWPPSWATLLLLPALFVGFTVHELGHALVAFMMGDSSQVERKRLTFNPLRHVSWLGLVAFLLIGLGWAKPVWVDQSRLRVKNRAFGMFLVSIAGATANFLIAVLVLLGMTGTVMVVWLFSEAPPTAVLEFLVAPEPGPDVQGLAVAFTYYMLMVNLLLAFFNLLPFPPLDGFQALRSLYSLMRGAFQAGGEVEEAPPTASDKTVDAAPAKSPAQIHFEIGLAYHEAGKLDEAIARYRQVIAHDGAFALAYYNQGLAYWAKGRLPLAASAFKAAARSGRNTGVHAQASLRLRELAQAEKDRAGEVGPLPPPLESEDADELTGELTPPLDPAVARRVWLRLGIGATVMLFLALAMWLFVTTVTLVSVQQVMP